MEESSTPRQHTCVAKHVLSLDNYGEGALTEDGKWVLLEPQ